MWSFLGKYIHQSWLVVALCVGIITGIIIGLVFRINYFNSVWWIVLVCVLLVFAYLKPKYAFVVVVFVVGMILAFFKVSNELVGENFARQLYGLRVMVEGTIEGDPETDDGGTSFKLSGLKYGDEKIDMPGSLYISVGKNEDLARGDLVVVKGKMSEGFGTYIGYLYRPRIVKWQRPEPGDLVLKVRNWFAERVRRLIPEPEVNLGLSYLLGMKSGLPDDLSESLRMVGLTHIVVASGAHLSILVEIARKIFGKLSRFAGLLFSVIFIIFFMCMIGWTPSILRAGVMAILTLMARQTGRKIASWRIIILVAAFTLMLNPMFIINLGWLLSFSSYAGIMMLGPWLTKTFYGDKKPGAIASIIITTIAATMMTLPITLYYYGQISLISVLANLLILPTLSFAMGLTFLTGVFSGLAGVEMIVSFVTVKLLDYHIAVVKFFGDMTQFMVSIESYQVWVFLLYLVPFVLLMKKQLQKRKT